ncbi:hypothetical protein DdX_09026 [Ditylenchus destructor]|uniref:Uncharacterized protein n=1 Tax=Ditylenchus destructor TaxID=166010 RepID=A0AAD4N1S3_9BILA|nr:hypothetical protein DdX_09026 [Ditylenchus destructor]
MSSASMCDQRSQYYRSIAQEKLAASLSVRECISKLCLNSDQTLKALRKQSGNNSQRSNARSSSDLTTEAAFSILRRLFRSLKTDICRSNYDDGTFPTEVIHLLAKEPDENSLNIVERYAKEFAAKRSTTPVNPNSSLKNWRQLEILSPNAEDIFNQKQIPSNVPPLDPVQVRQCASPSSSHGSERQSFPLDSPLRIISDEVIPLDEASSSGDSSPVPTAEESVEAAERLHELSRVVARDVIENVRKVQEVISPRSRYMHSIRTMSLPLNEDIVPLPAYLVDKSCGPTPRSHSVAPNIGFHNQKQDSKEVQTNSSVIKVDACTSTDTSVLFQQADENFVEILSANVSNANNNSSLSQANGSSSTNTSSLYSDLSVGQIPLHKATMLMAKSKWSIMSVNADGSCIFGPQRPTEEHSFVHPAMTSTPAGASRSHEYIHMELPHTAPHPDFNLNIDSTNHIGPSRVNTIYRSNMLPAMSRQFHKPTHFPAQPHRNPSTSASGGDEIQNSFSALMAREMSLVTSFDTLSPRTHSDGSNAAVRMKLLEKNDDPEGIEVVHNKSLTNNDKASLGQSEFSPKQITLDSTSDDDEESTLNQVSPLPTTG